MPQHTITKMVQETRFDAAGERKQVYVITFMVGESGPFILEVDAEHYTAAVGRDEVLAKAQEIEGTLSM